jgi:OPT oligopeptide transporter protein
MICPYLVNISVLIGGILSWGIMWPLIERKKGDWFPADLPSTSLHGLQGYRVMLLFTPLSSFLRFHKSKSFCKPASVLKLLSGLIFKSHNEQDRN